MERRDVINELHVELCDFLNDFVLFCPLVFGSGPGG